ncbi:MAG: tectonin domain-containing protein, partial [Candidatus Brocadiia bacterium]
RVSVAWDGSQGNGSASSPVVISGNGRYVAYKSAASNLVPGDTNTKADVFVYDRQSGDVDRVSLASDGTQADAISEEPAISDDGRYVAFQSSATTLVPGDTNGEEDVFLYDRTYDTALLASVADGGTQANYWNKQPVVSADGMCVVFYSGASNLVPGDTNQDSDVFAYTPLPEPIQRVSIASDGSEGNDYSWSVAISHDGRYVTFHSSASNLDTSGCDVNGSSDVFLHDRFTGQTQLVSRMPGGAVGDAWSGNPSISADGRYVAFESDATNLVTGDTNAHTDIFVYDRQADTLERASVDSAENQGNGDSSSPDISADGRYVAFHSAASNLVAGDTNAGKDIFVRDLQAGTTERVSLQTGGGECEGGCYTPSISADGRYVAFLSRGTDLVPGDTNGDDDIFVYDRTLDAVQRVSVDSSGNEANGASYDPDISANGRYVTFHSWAPDLVAGDTNGALDIFVRDLQADTTERVSVAWDGSQGNDSSQRPTISAAGRYVAFHSYATNLVPDDTTGSVDVYVHDRQADTIQRVSLPWDGLEGANSSYNAAVSADGRHVAFVSDAANLVPGDTNGARDAFSYNLARTPEALVWGLADTGGISCRLGTNNVVLAGSAWDGVVGKLKQISVGTGSVWGVNTNGGIFFREGICDTQPDGTGWGRVAGKLNMIAVGYSGTVWGINGNGGIFVREGITSANPGGTGWTRAPGKLAYIAAGGQHVWGLNSNGGIFMREGVSVVDVNGTGWNRVSGKLAKISVGATGLVWGLNANDGIFVRSGVTDSNPLGTGWNRVSGKLAHVSSGCTCAWGVNGNGGIFVREEVTHSLPQGKSWSRAGGKLATVGVGQGPLMTGMDVPGSGTSALSGGEAWLYEEALAGSSVWGADGWLAESEDEDAGAWAAAG